MNKLCVVCGKPLMGRQEMFCSGKCKQIKRDEGRRAKLGTCEKCGKEYMQGTYGIKICRSCSLTEVLLKRYEDITKHPAWRGGCKQWQPGKLGRDKDGLSWVVQRRLAWERDEYKCVKCGEVGYRGKPDVHHINPYRFSGSHALENLICLCPSCHRREEWKIKELWEGVVFNSSPKKVYEKCSVCGRIKRKLFDGKCTECIRVSIEAPKARVLRSEGKSYVQIAEELKCGRQTAWNYVNGYRYDVLENKLE